jgi:hypothetical protein
MPRIGFKTTMTAGGTTLADTVMVSIPDRQFGEAETTPLNQTTPDRKFIATLRDNGECDVEIMYSAANYTAMAALHGVDNKDFVCVSPDPDGAGTETAQTFTMNGFLKTLGGPKLEKDSVVKFTCKVRVNTVTVS